MKVQILARNYPDRYGLYRYSAAICRALAKAGVRFELVRPGLPGLVKAIHRGSVRHGFDVERFFTTFPLTAKVDRESLKHLTIQQMGSLLIFQPGMGPAVVSVHDIVPYLTRGDQEQQTFRHVIERVFDRLAMEGLKRADYLVASSAYTRRTLIEALKIHADKVAVVHLGVDHEVFKPVPIDPGFRRRYRLEVDRRYILFVGAEGPRKNLARLFRAVAQVKARVPKLALIMAGGCAAGQQRPQLLGMVEALELSGVVQFVGYVVEEDLVQFYNLAEAFVFPSLYEGFGLPALEALACGSAVVCSRAAALPEVVGEAGVLVDPRDDEDLAQRIEQVLNDEGWREELRCRGFEQARKFSWDRTAEETTRIYEQVLGQG